MTEEALKIYKECREEERENEKKFNQMTKSQTKARKGHLR